MSTTLPKKQQHEPKMCSANKVPLLSVFLLFLSLLLSQSSAQIQIQYMNFAGGDNEFTVKDSVVDPSTGNVFMIGELSPSSPLSQNGTYPCGVMKYTDAGNLLWYKAVINETLTMGFYPTSADLSSSYGMLYIGGFTQMNGSLSSEATACQLDFDGNLLECVNFSNTATGTRIAKVFDIIYESYYDRICVTGYRGFIDDTTHLASTGVFFSCQTIINPQFFLSYQSTPGKGINAGHMISSITAGLSYFISGVAEGAVVFRNNLNVTQVSSFVAQYVDGTWSWDYLHPNSTYGHPPYHYSQYVFFPDKDASIKHFDNLGVDTDVQNLLSREGSADNIMITRGLISVSPSFVITGEILGSVEVDGKPLSAAANSSMGFIVKLSSSFAVESIDVFHGDGINKGVALGNFELEDFLWVAHSDCGNRVWGENIAVLNEKQNMIFARMTTSQAVITPKIYIDFPFMLEDNEFSPEFEYHIRSELIVRSSLTVFGTMQIYENLHLENGRLDAIGTSDISVANVHCLQERFRNITVDSNSEIHLSYADVQRLTLLINGGTAHVNHTTFSYCGMGLGCLKGHNVGGLSVMYSSFLTNSFNPFAGIAILQDGYSSRLVTMDISNNTFSGVSVAADYTNTKAFTFEEFNFSLNNVVDAQSGVSVLTYAVPFVSIDSNQFVATTTQFQAIYSVSYVTRFEGKISVQNNTLTKTTMRVEKGNAGYFDISNNVIESTTTNPPLYFLANNCGGQTSISNNKMMDNGEPVRLVTLQCPDSIEFSWNTLKSTTSQSLLHVVNPVKIRRNSFVQQGSGTALQYASVNTPPPVLNAQYNDWETSTNDRVLFLVGVASLDSLINGDAGILPFPYLYTSNPVEVPLFNETVRDCSDVVSLWPRAPFGVYEIQPTTCDSMLVVCNTERQSIVVHKRYNGLTSFSRTKSEYEDGFGLLDGEFFLGLKKLHTLTSMGAEVYFDTITTSSTPEFKSAYMSVGSSLNNYTIDFRSLFPPYSYSPDFILDGIPFSFPGVSNNSCATQTQSGWWFDEQLDCASFNLNQAYPLQSSVALRLSAFVQIETSIISDSRLLTLNCSSAAPPICSVKENTNTNCSSHGTCVDMSTCVCESGYSGFSCDKFSCFGVAFNNSAVCSGHGKCVATDSCQCEWGYTGIKCNTEILEVLINSNHSMIDPCEDIVIQSIQSNNDMTGRKYVWLASATTTPSQNMTRYLTNQRNKTLVVPNQFIPSNENVMISLFIYDLQGNQLGASNSLTFYRRKAIAKIELPGAGTLSVKDTGSLSLFAYLTEVPSCLMNIKKTWLIQGQPYSSTTLNHLTFTAKAARNISLQIVSAHLEATLAVPVTMIETKPNAIISGGSRMVLAGSQVVLDAHQSSDPLYGSMTGATYMWSCDSCSKQLASGVTTMLDEGPGNYTVSLMYTPNPVVANRVGNTTITIQIVSRESVIPVLKISSVVPTILNPLKTLRISANVSNLIAGSDVEYEWSIRADSSQSFTFIRTYSTLLPLVLPENMLKYNTSYTFMIRAHYLNVALGQLVSYASVTSRTSSPPSIEGFTFDPVSGNALSTLFTISINATDIPEVYPLYYSFNYFNEVLQRFVALKGYSIYSTVSTVLPTFGSHLRVRCTVQNSQGGESSTEFSIPVNSEASAIEQLNQAELLLQSLNSDNRTDNGESVLNIVAATVGRLSNNNTVPMQQMTNIYSGIVDFMLTNTLEEIRNSNDSITEQFVVSKINTVNVISSFNSLFSLPTAEKSMTILNIAVDGCLTSDISLDSNNTQQLASAISNIYSGQVISLSNKTLEIISQLVSLIGRDKLVLEDETVVSTDAFDVSVRVDTASTLRNASISDSLVSVMIPDDIDSLDDISTFTVQSVSFNAEMNPFAMSNNGQNISSPIVIFKILNMNEKVKLVNLTKPIEIVLRRDNTSVLPLDHVFECRYLDETSNNTWKTDGCWLAQFDEFNIVCHCNHTTSFTSMIIYDPKKPNKASDGLYIAWIIMYSIFALISFVLIIMSIWWRNTQPIKSRFLAPLIGLGAILIECVLNGIIRNSLLISANSSKDFKGVNSLAYLILTIVNPLVLLSLFIYLWQMIRFFFLKHLYSIMAKESNDKSAKKYMRILRLISSKLVYVALGITVFVISCAYFVILSILEPTRVIVPNVASIINALSFSIMSFCFAVLIVFVFIWDVTVVMGRRLHVRYGKDKKNTEEGSSVETAALKSVATTFFTHFSKDDPLLFRSESIFMALAMTMMIISYIFGIADRLDSSAQPNSPLKIGEFIFDMLYILFRMNAFGGFTLLASLINYQSSLEVYQRVSEMRELLKDIKNGASSVEVELLDILRDELGYKVFSTFAEKEFALENLLLWKKLEDVRPQNMIISTQQRVDMMNEIYSEFLESGCAYECNVPNKTKKLMQKAMKNNDLSASDAEEALLSLFNETMTNISDTFIRLTSTEEYARYKKIRMLSYELANVGGLDEGLTAPTK